MAKDNERWLYVCMRGVIAKKHFKKTAGLKKRNALAHAIIGRVVPRGNKWLVVK